MRFLKIASGVSTLFLVFMMSGCATIVSGTTQKVAVTSQPTGAKVTADGKMAATTPTDFTLERKSDHTLEFSKEGYKTATVMLKRTVNGMLAGNILIGGLIGTGIDAISGANNKLIPERVDVALEQGEGYSEAPKFVAKVDQDFYDKNILKPAQQRAKKEETAAPKTGTVSNFSPANTAPVAS